MNRVKKELLWFLAFAVIPLLMTLLFEISSSSSPFSWWQRLLRVEDICAYGYCLIPPFFMYAIVILVRILVEIILRPSRSKSDKTKPSQ